jgi:allantoin racemase
MEDQVRQHDLQGRLITNGVRADKTPFEEAMTKGMQDPKFIAASIEEVARGCVADGADVVIIGCCGLGPLCTLAGFNKITVGGQEVPVLNAVTIVAKTTEMAADIRRGAGLPIPSRIRGQALPSKGDLARVRTVYGLPA